MPEQRFAFYLAPDERKRMQRILNKASGRLPRWYFAALAVLYASQVAVASFRHHWFLAVTIGLMAGAWAIIAIFARSAGTNRLPSEGTLQLSEAGLAGTLDKAPAAIRWSDIATVSDVDDAIVLFRRNNLGPIAIPKSSIADLTALWALLEDRLVSKRGLIRSAAPRRQILNSAY